MNTQIPLYRAKKIDSNEYLIGMLRQQLHDGHIKYFIEPLQTAVNEYVSFERIDSSTLAIHFPNMLDKDGNKIFASLSEDGKGGDMLEHEDVDEIGVYEACTVKYEKYTFCFVDDFSNTLNDYRNLKISGIQQ